MPDFSGRPCSGFIHLVLPEHVNGIADDVVLYGRALRKVHKHYMDRVKDKSDRFNQTIDKLRTASEAELEKFTCEDVVDMLRRYYKVFHYAEKAMIHILFIEAALDAADCQLNDLDGLVAACPDPAPPPNPNPSGG